MSEVRDGFADAGLIAAGAAAPARESAARLGLSTVRRQRRAIVAVAVGFVLLAVACGIAAGLAWQDQIATDALIDARQVRRSGTLLQMAILSAEAAQRGFLLTRDPEYLTPYGAAETDFTTWLAELNRRLPPDPSRAGQAGEVGRLGAAKFAEMDQTIAMAKAGRFDEAIAQLRSGRGKALMDGIRRGVGNLTTDANDRIALRTATQSRLSVSMLAAIVIALICAAALAVLVLRDTRRRFGRLTARETTLSTLAMTLEREVARRTQALAEVNQRFDAALRASGVTVMTQDLDLVFTWISKGEFGRTTAEIIGKPQPEAYAGVEQAAALQLKRGVIESGEPARADVRIIHNDTESWFDLSVHPYTDEYGVMTGIIAGAIDITRYKEQEARIRLLMRELTHRSKNLLSVTQAIMRQTAANSASIEDFDSRFSARLQSLAGSHDLLVEQDWLGASLRDLVRSQLGHYIDMTGSQIELEGEPIRIQPDAAQHIGMAFHELATNAAKFGALSVPTGKVTIAWHIAPRADDGAQLCHISWVESGGPPVTRPARRGFGRVVVERTVARAVQGEVTVDYAPTGLRWKLAFPVAFLAAA